MRFYNRSGKMCCYIKEKKKIYEIHLSSLFIYLFSLISYNILKKVKSVANHSNKYRHKHSQLFEYIENRNQSTAPYLYSAQESGVNLANFICRRCIKTGSDKTPTGCASKLETVRRFGTVPTTLLPLYFRDDAYNLRLIERVTIEWEFFR